MQFAVRCLCGWGVGYSGAVGLSGSVLLRACAAWMCVEVCVPCLLVEG